MKESGSSCTALRPVLATAVVLLIATYALCGILLPGRHTTVFSGDIGVKFMQVRALVAGHGAVDGLRDPIDVDGRFFPLRPPFAFPANGHVFSVYLNPFTFLASLAYRVLGIEGARLVPLLGAIASLFAVFVLAGRLGLAGAGRWAVVGVTLLVTPLWFYGWVFWEHAPALACSLTATCLLVRPGGERAGAGAFVAGGLLGLGAALRPEIAVYGAVLGLAVGVSWRRPSGPALAVLGAVAAFVLSLAVLPDMPLAASFDRIFEATAGRLPDPGAASSWSDLRGDTLVFLILGLMGTAWDFPPDGWLLTVGFGAAALLVAGFFARGHAAVVVQLAAFAAAVAAAFTAAWAIRDDSMLLAGLLTGVPFVIATLPVLGWAATRQPPREGAAGDRAAVVARCLAWVTLLFAVAVAVTSPSGGGNQWGARFLLPVIPLMVLLLAWRLHSGEFQRSRRLVIAATAAAVLAGTVTQAVGVRNHIAMRRELAAVTGAIAALKSRYVLATQWYIPQALTLLVDRDDTHLLLATNDEDIGRAVEILARQAEPAFVLIREEEEPSAERWGSYTLGETLRFDLVPSKLVAREFVRARVDATGSSPRR